MSQQMKVACLKFQTLGKDFVREHWEDMSDFEKAASLRYQSLSVEYIMEMYITLDEHVRGLCAANGLVERLPISYLPMFFTDKSEEVRRRAKERVEAHIRCGTETWEVMEVE